MTVMDVCTTNSCSYLRLVSHDSNKSPHLAAGAQGGYRAQGNRGERLCARQARDGVGGHTHKSEGQEAGRAVMSDVR